MAKTLTTGHASNRLQKITKMAWNHGVNLTTYPRSNSIGLKIVDNEILNGIILPINNWESLIVFLSESFANAELEASGNSGRIEISLTVDRKIE